MSVLIACALGLVGFLLTLESDRRGSAVSDLGELGVVRLVRSVLVLVVTDVSLLLESLVCPLVSWCALVELLSAAAGMILM